MQSGILEGNGCLLKHGSAEEFFVDVCVVDITCVKVRIPPS